jgi:5'-3' exonuclease
MKLLIDLDPIVYRVGFATQKKMEDGEIEAEPVQFALFTVKRFMTTLLQDTEAEEYIGFLTGKGNFRYTIDSEYKANRKGTDKPVHYQAIRDYLEKHYNTKVIEGKEADDALAENQTEDTAIATIDKDLLMVAGRHYNYVKKEWQTVTPEGGTKFFYKQMLMGDKVDNIPGIRGIGPKKAEKLLDETKREDWDKLIEEKYEEFFGEGWFKRMVQNTQLLWMIQTDVLMPMNIEGYNETEEEE